MKSNVGGLHQMKHIPEDVLELRDRLDVVLHECEKSTDFHSVALIGLAFCALLAGSMNRQQLASLKVAREFLAGRGSQAHRESVSEFAEVVRSDKIMGAERRQAALNRLVWTVLNTNTELSAYAGEFLLCLGAEAGLSAEQMSGVLREHVPGF